ncbi:Glycoside hydrolase [Mycena chlorophos]|uniref:Glycoside hydrolase n=1 Tax=Mycena chlorophos TaxID=658473 RepID=A0A8H6TNT5_MYCCL|nr:Glycoside hydrolase [Mycena chlorophos]
MQLRALLPALVLLPFALATIPLYGQCGGDDVVWADVCADGLNCTYYNFWYSQCLPPAEASSTDSAAAAESTGTKREVPIGGAELI